MECQKKSFAGSLNGSFSRKKREGKDWDFWKKRRSPCAIGEVWPQEKIRIVQTQKNKTSLGDRECRGRMSRRKNKLGTGFGTWGRGNFRPF